MMNGAMACDPVGIKEIAKRLDVGADAVRQWRWRSDNGLLPVPFPEPRWDEVSGHPAWNWPDVERWAIRAGRLEDRVGR